MGMIDSFYDMSSDVIQVAIEKLMEAKRLAQKREKEELERIAREEREKKERELQELQKKHVEEVTCMDIPLDWDNIFDTDVRTRDVHMESISDALVHCLATLGQVDIEYISCITGADYKTVINTLKGAIYQNPDKWGECFFKGWETTEEYLSGNLIRKWRTAKTASEEYNGYFDDNIKAIEKVIPPTVATEDIYITLGSPWVPADVIDEFILYLFGPPPRWYYGFRDSLPNIEEAEKTLHDEVTGTWEIPNKSRYYDHISVSKTYGTERLGALYILEKTLNMKTVCVRDEVPCATNNSGVKRVINQAETVAALDKQKKMIKEFQKWVWTDEKRKKRLETIFENKFSCVRKRIFDGSFLQFPTMSPSIQLHKYQKDAVARIIFTPNTLLAHDVGAGKTYVMIAAGQELRRMGLSNKNMYVVPNNIVTQWKHIFLSMYPNANLLIVEPKDFTPAKREKVLKNIRDNSYDGIIIAYSCFELIPLSKEYYMDELNKKKEMISNVISQKSKGTSKLKKKREAVDKALAELKSSISELYDTIGFDELGITRLFVDEAHNFKNVPLETKVDKVLGISKNGSKKCQDMMDKVHMIQGKNDGAGVVFATGTPITNSITDVYIMQQYLQSGELGMLDLQSFDSWLGMFAEKVTDFEIDVDTSSYRMATRFAKFHNLPELTALLSSIADFHGVEASVGVPEINGYSDAVVAKTDELSDYLKEISHRADRVRNGIVNRSEDNMLKITTDGRKAALDMRLVEPYCKFNYQSKVARCAENVADIYFQTFNTKSTQLIFCDTSVPKSGFNIYDELKYRLIMLGVCHDQIAFVHDATTEAKREKLFSKMQNGDVRILLGSTFKVGMGVNIQNKLIALHHIDVPWRPADMVQREGRIIRQGNENKSVKIFRYITEGSFDAYSWQLLETKQRFISDLISGSLTERSGGDVADTVLDYAEVKALAVGNELIKERVEVANELTHYRMLQRKLVENRMAYEKELMEMPGKKKHQRDIISKCEEDILLYSEWKQQTQQIKNNTQKKEESARRKNLREQINKSVRQNVLETTETLLVTHRGFDIILPANMTLEKPYVWIKNKGKYYVELGDTEVGNLVRIENFMDSLDNHLLKLKNGLRKMEERENDVINELSKNESYAEKIEELQVKLKEIDDELGVKQDE